jgi:hypothetical protein
MPEALGRPDVVYYIGKIADADAGLIDRRHRRSSSSETGSNYVALGLVNNAGPFPCIINGWRR